MLIIHINNSILIFTIIILDFYNCSYITDTTGILGRLCIIQLLPLLVIVTNVRT